MKKTNGVPQLNNQMEEMRMQVVDLELKARYWKAQYEVRQYTLLAEEIQPKYEEYMEAQKKIAEEARAAFIKEMEEAKAKEVRVIGVKIKAGKIRTMVECDIFLIYDVNI